MVEDGARIPSQQPLLGQLTGMAIITIGRGPECFNLMLVQALLGVPHDGEGEGEGEVAFFSAKRWDRRNRADLIESATPCHQEQIFCDLPYQRLFSGLEILSCSASDYQHFQANAQYYLSRT